MSNTIIALVLITLTGCAGLGPRYPVYPGSQPNTNQSSKQELSKAQVVCMVWEGYEAPHAVKAFFDEKMKSHPDMRKSTNGDITMWTNGNIDLDRSLLAGTPKDQTKFGAAVLLFTSESTGRYTLVHIESSPK